MFKTFIWNILFKVKCITDRTSRAGCVTLKIKNKSFYYLMDKQGTFVNPKLFDHAMG